jgi:hypothetical protein
MMTTNYLPTLIKYLNYIFIGPHKKIMKFDI